MKETRKKLLIMQCYNEFNHHSEVDLDDFMFLTDSEADNTCYEKIRELIWAFNADYLAGWLDCPTEAVQAIHDNGKCEGNNEILLDWLEKHCEFWNFVYDAISLDGRGHFLSSYDGKEHEVEWNGETYYIYRIN